MPEELKQAKKYHFGLGRRKTAIARVRIMPGKGHLTINAHQVEPIESIFEPFVTVGQNGKFDVTAIVTGGGKVSQLEAIRLGVARSLLEIDEGFKQSLRKAGFLSRDAREKERKKPGLKRARRAPQWAKR